MSELQRLHAIILCIQPLSGSSGGWSANTAQSDGSSGNMFNLLKLLSFIATWTEQLLQFMSELQFYVSEEKKQLFSAMTDIFTT